MNKKLNIFLDANVVIASGKPPGGPILARVAELAEAGLINVLTTDLTVTEVAKKYARNDYEIIANVGHPRFRKVFEEVFNIKLPDTDKTEIRMKLADIYGKSTKAMFTRLGASTLEIDAVKPSIVFSAYATEEGFFSGTGKKNQFPDAFIFECLKAQASEEKPIIIVSADGDYDAPAAVEPHISIVKSIPDLFKVLGLQIDAPEIDDFLEKHKDELVKAANRELADWGLIGDVEDAEIEETNVTGVEIRDLIAFRSIEEGDAILVIGYLTVKANICYTHPNWDEAMYDSEDKQLIPFENVSGEMEVSLDVDVSMTILVGETGEPEEIEELRFRNNNFQYIELHPFEW